MNNVLLTNMLFTRSFDFVPVPSKPATLSNTNRFSNRSINSSTDILPCDNAPETTTSDNVLTVAQSEPVDKPTKDFDYTLRKKIAAEVSKNNPSDTKAKNKSPADAAETNQKNSANPMGDNDSPVTIPTEVASAEKILVSPQNDQKSTQPVTSSMADELPSVAEQIAKPIEDGQITPIIDKGQFVAKTISTGNSANLPVAAAQQAANSTEVKIQTPNNTSTAIKGPTGPIDKNSGKESTPEAAGTADKTTVVGQKPAAPNGNVAQAPEKSPVIIQKEPAGSEKFTDTGTKPTNNKADTSRQNQTLSESSADQSKDSGRAGSNTSNDSLLKDFTPASVQASIKGVKNPADSAANDSSNSKSDLGRFDQILSPNNASPPVTEQSTASGQAVKTADNTPQNNPFTNIGDQIQGYISSSVRQGNQQVTVHLNPPELGKVSIKLREEGDHITGLLEVSKTQTRYEIQQALPEIVKNLTDSGIQIKRLEVQLADQQEQQTFKEQSLQDGSFQQQGSAEENIFGNTTPGSQWTTNINSYQDILEQPDMFVTDKSINMLI